MNLHPPLRYMKQEHPGHNSPHNILLRLDKVDNSLGK